MLRRLLLPLFFCSLAAFGQLVTVTETLLDSQGANAVGYMYISNLPFLSPQGTAGAITGATNATPIVITSTAHGFVDGQTVYVVGVGGNTAANGTWVINQLTVDTFELNGSVGNGAYTSGGTAQRVILVAGDRKRYPTSGNFNGTVTVALYPTTNAIAIPGGAAAGYTYLVEYRMTTTAISTQRWNVPTTGPTSIQSVITAGAVSPTATVALTQLGQDGATGTSTEDLRWTGTRWDNTTLFNTTVGTNLGTPAAGTSTVAARLDHVHGLGSLVNNQTGTTYTVVDGDRGKTVTFSNASAIAVTLPQAGASSLFVSGWAGHFANRGAGTVTITPTVSTINGAATLVLTTKGSAFVVSDGTNYFAALGEAGLLDPGSNGFPARTALNTTVARTITGTASVITVTDGDGVAGNPVLNVGANVASASPTDDQVFVANGSAWQGKAVPDCDDSLGQHLNYDTATNAFSCGTTALSRTSSFCSGTATSSVTLFMVLWPSGACTNTTEGVATELLVSSAGKLRNLRVKAGTAGFAGGSGAVTLRVNGSNSIVTCTVGTGTTCSDVTNTATVAAGDRITVQIVTQATETLANVQVAWEY